VWISLKVSLLALLLATPLRRGDRVLGGVASLRGPPPRHRGTPGLLSFPTVVVGLILYLLFSRSGPLGPWHLLFTRTR
jgi:tungstate transport system permease protein